MGRFSGQVRDHWRSLAVQQSRKGLSPYYLDLPLGVDWPGSRKLRTRMWHPKPAGKVRGLHAVYLQLLDPGALARDEANAGRPKALASGGAALAWPRVGGAATRTFRYARRAASAGRA